MEIQANNNITPTIHSNSSDEDIVEFEPKYSLSAPTAEQITTGIEQFAKYRQLKILKCTNIKEGMLEKVGKDNVDDLCNIVCKKNYSEYINSLPKQNEQLQALQEILSYYQIAANRTINFKEITLYWNHRLPPAEPAVSKLINSMMMRGRTDEFRITVVELVPSHYLLLDGAHRVCAWKILCEANPKLNQNCVAQVLSSTLTWQQVAIICGAKNDMPTKQHDLLDTLFWFQQFHKQILEMKQVSARISFVHQACGLDFIVQKRSGTPSKKDDNNKTAESKELQRLLNLSQLLTENNFSKVTDMWQEQNKENFKGTRISKSTLQQPSLFELLAINTESAQDAFGEFLDLIRNSNYMLDKSSIEKIAVVLANKYYLMFEICRSCKMPSAASDKKICDILMHVPAGNWLLMIPEKEANELIIGSKKTIPMTKNGQTKSLQPVHIRLGTIQQFEEFFTAPPAFKTFVTNTSKVMPEMVYKVLEQVKQWVTRTTDQNIMEYTQHIIKYIDAKDVPEELANKKCFALINFVDGRLKISLQPNPIPAATIPAKISTNSNIQQTAKSAQSQNSKTTTTTASSKKTSNKQNDEEPPSAEESDDVTPKLPPGKWELEEEIGILNTESGHPRVPFIGDKIMHLHSMEQCVEHLSHSLIKKIFHALNLKEISGNLFARVKMIQKHHKKRIREYFSDDGKDMGEAVFLNDWDMTYDLTKYADYNSKPEIPPGFPERNGTTTNDSSQIVASIDFASKQKQVSSEKQQQKEATKTKETAANTTKRSSSIDKSQDKDDQQEEAAGTDDDEEVIKFNEDVHVPKLDDYIFLYSLQQPASIHISKNVRWVASVEENKVWIEVDKDEFDNLEEDSIKLTKKQPGEEEEQVVEIQEDNNKKRKRGSSTKHNNEKEADSRKNSSKKQKSTR